MKFHLCSPGSTTLSSTDCVETKVVLARLHRMGRNSGPLWGSTIKSDQMLFISSFYFFFFPFRFAYIASLAMRDGRDGVSHVPMSMFAASAAALTASKADDNTVAQTVVLRRRHDSCVVVVIVMDVYQDICAVRPLPQATFLASCQNLCKDGVPWSLQPKSPAWSYAGLGRTTTHDAML